MIRTTREAVCAKTSVLGWIGVEVHAIIILIKFVVYTPFDYIFLTIPLKLSFLVVGLLK